VGTIGDLRVWITRFQDYIRFIVQDAFITILYIVVGVVIWLKE
jgi:hypothetical protein